MGNQILKKLLALIPLSLSVSPGAQEHLLLGSIEFGSVVSNTVEEGERISTDLELNAGLGMDYMYFSETSSVYYGLSISLGGSDGPVCVSDFPCLGLETTSTSLGGEIGFQLEGWLPYIGMSFIQSEVSIKGNNPPIPPRIPIESDDPTEFHIGTFLDHDRYLFQVTVYSINDEEDRSLVGGVFYTMNNNFVVGAKFGTLLDSDVDGRTFTLNLGKRF